MAQRPQSHKVTPLELLCSLDDPVSKLNLIVMDTDKIFHLGLCMAGSVSAGAYTAGVIDYLQEALEEWEKARGQSDFPDHHVVIDLLGGTSGGGIAGALALYGLRDKVEHARLEVDGETYKDIRDTNIYWRTWVELTPNDVFSELLKPGDLKEGFIPSLLNSLFIDKVAETLRKYADGLPAGNTPPFVNQRAELFLSIFNVTGLKYQLTSRGNSNKDLYVSEHRDIAHFRWSDQYNGDGRINISLSEPGNFEILIDSAKATGAFPVGLAAQKVSRPAKFIWDNPFFLKNDRFNKDSIKLGSNLNGGEIEDPEELYVSINSDGGVANNEPVELSRDIMLKMRTDQYEDIPKKPDPDVASEIEMMKMKQELTNSTVLLIDPFPAMDFEIKPPKKNDAHLFSYGPKLIEAMRSQLLFDAKEALDAYDKESYGLHLIAPSRETATKPEYAIACACIGGFGGFFNKEFRVHDYFLGRYNCQSFLRKHFVVKLNEPEGDRRKCVEAVINGYKNKAAQDRFGFIDENDDFVVPILPDFSLVKPIEVEVSEVNGIKNVKYIEEDRLTLYNLKLLKRDYFDAYRNQLKGRIRDIINFSYDGHWLIDLAIKVVAEKIDDKLADTAIEYIKDDLKKRGLMK